MSESKKTRIDAHRANLLKADEKKLVDDVEKYGCHIIHVREEGGIPGWSYTIGIREMVPGSFMGRGNRVLNRQF